MRIGRDQELERFGVHVAYIDTAFVGEQDPVTLTRRIDADVELCVGRMRNKRLDDKVVQRTRDRLHLLRFARTFDDPLVSGASSTLVMMSRNPLRL